MSRWRRGEQDWGRGFRVGSESAHEERLDVSCGRCRRVLGCAVTTHSPLGGEDIGGEAPRLMVIGPGVQSLMLCEPCSGQLAAWVKAGPTAAERARAAHLTWGPEDVASEVDAMRELRALEDDHD